MLTREIHAQTKDADRLCQPRRDDLSDAPHAGARGKHNASSPGHLSGGTARRADSVGVILLSDTRNGKGIYGDKCYDPLQNRHPPSVEDIRHSRAGEAPWERSFGRHRRSAVASVKPSCWHIDHPGRAVQQFNPSEEDS